jgi:hypothetical protein
VDLHARLVVLSRREDLRLAGRDRGVALDELRHHAALGLDAEGQRGHVEQEHVLDVAGQHARLDGGAHGHDLVRVDAAVRVLAGELLDLLLHGRHARHAAHEDDVVDAGAALGARVLSACLVGPDDAVEQVGGQLVQLRAGEPLVEVLRDRIDRRDERQVDLGLLRRAQLGLGLLGLLVEALEGHLVGRQVHALGLLELATSQSTIALSKLSPPRWLSPAVALTSNTPSPISSTDTSNVPPPRSKTRIVWSVLLVEPVGERGRRRLVDDALDVEARDLAGVLGRLALVVVEVGRDGDHRAVDGVAQVRLGVGLQLLEDHRADLRRGELLAARLDARVAVRAGTTSNGTIFSSSLTSASLRPMKRLIEKTVFSGFVTACRLAARPRGARRHP